METPSTQASTKLPSAEPASGASTAEASSKSASAALGLEEVSLETSDGVKLAGSLYLPKGRSDRVPGVLIVHEPGRDRSEAQALADYLRKKGFAALAIDLRGHGQSTGAQTAFGELAREEQERAWTFSLRDLDAAAAYLRTRSELQPTNLTLVGMGRGCALVLRHAAEDENARSVVLIGPEEDQLGFGLPDEARRCGGLPTLIVATKDGRPMAQRLMEGLETGGASLLKLGVLKSNDFRSDKRTPVEVANFLGEAVVPKKGN